MIPQNKIAALDIGDQWTGIALSDNMQIIASPHDTVQSSNLQNYLENFISKNNISTIIVGIPITLRAKDSEQTKKTRVTFEILKTKFPGITFIEMDERMSSKQASNIQKERKKGTIEKIKAEKLKNHAIAASFILNTYLEQLQFQRSCNQEE